MMEKISRKGFLKIAAAAAMSGVTAAGLAACNAASSTSGVSSATGIYTPGTYTATAKGMSEITATVTFDANTITKVELDLSGETESIGVAAKDKLIEQIMNAQTSQIDGVTGATVTSKAVQNAVADCIQQASGGAINPAQQSTEETSSTADWLGEAPEIAESDIKQTVDCEVLVVGAGSSGTFAAAAAAEAGAKTILIEKFGHDMASGIRDTLAACGSKQQQEDGDDVSKKDAVRYLCNWSQGYTRRSLAQVWADKSGETMDWFTDVLAESGIDFRHEIDEKREGDNYEVLDVGHSTQYGEEYSEQLTMDAVLKHAEADGLEVQYEITMVKLEKDGDRVTGLIAKNANDEYVRYNASKGEDEDYGKESYRLSTLSEAPFYGVRQAGGYLICTIDGIQIDDNMHAIDQDFKAIPGLYVIGDMSGNYFSGSYPSLMAGAAAGRSATFGRLAGQNAAAGI